MTSIQEQVIWLFRVNLKRYAQRERRLRRELRTARAILKEMRSTLRAARKSYSRV